MVLTAEKIRTLLDYNPETGVFAWRVARSNRVKVGQEAGTVSVWGYRVISIDGMPRQAGILAHLWMTGRLPIHEVDHRDGDSLNNAWGNLREATSSQNKCNQRKPRTNTSGFKGVSFDRRSCKFVAYIGFNKKRKQIGLFETAALAAAARRAAESRLHGEFARAA